MALVAAAALPAQDGAKDGGMNAHAHRWQIDAPSGPVSRGVCRDCGAERDYPNSFEDAQRKFNKQRNYPTPIRASEPMSVFVARGRRL